MFSKGHTIRAKIFNLFLMFNPTSLFYVSSFNRRMVYRIIKVYALIHFIGLFRKPYIKHQVLKKNQAQTQIQEEQITNLLSEIDVKLSSYSESYFIIFSANFSSGNDEELIDKQRTLFQFNNLINKKLEVNQQYFQDIKFLFIGDENIYKIIEVNNTIVDFYEKEKQKRGASMIYIMNKDSNGEEKLLATYSYKPDLKSILNIISKHKARKFAESMQF